MPCVGVQAYLQDDSLRDVRLVDKLEQLRGQRKFQVKWPPCSEGWHAAVWVHEFGSCSLPSWGIWTAPGHQPLVTPLHYGMHCILCHPCLLASIKSSASFALLQSSNPPPHGVCAPVTDLPFAFVCRSQARSWRMSVGSWEV